MNKIEEIKIRLSNLDMGKVVKYDHAMNLATQYMFDYRNDVTQLLSIIEQAEKDLSEIIDLLIGERHGEAWARAHETYKTLRIGRSGGLVNPDGGDYPLKWISQKEDLE